MKYSFKQFLSESITDIHDRHEKKICMQMNDTETALGRYIAKNLTLKLPDHPPDDVEKFKVMDIMSKSSEADINFGILVNSFNGHYNTWALNVKKFTNNNYSQEYFYNIGEKVDGLVLYYKKKYGRSRPSQEGVRHYLPSSTPSYPSGHTTEAFVFANILSKLHPEHKESFFKLAELISLSRVVLGLHYPSDNDAGKTLAEFIINHQLVDIEPLKT